MMAECCTYSVLRYGLWMLIMAECCIYSVLRYISIMGLIHGYNKIMLYSISVKRKTMAQNQCCFKMYGT